MSYKIYALEESHITVAGGQLSGGNQGNGKHLVGKEITLNTGDWVPVSISDNDDHFADSDGSQRLAEPLDFNGGSYSGNQKVEAEYTLQVTDGTETYTLIGFNINEPGAKNAFGTVEGLAFIDKFPPVGTPLKVVSASEGPGKSAQHHETYAQPPCFTAGTLIETPKGPVPVETLCEGDAVLTRDAGVQIIRWAGAAHIDSARLAGNARFRPVLIRAGAFAPGLPARDMQVSRQHRVLMEDWRADLLFGSTEVLAAAVHLVNDDTIQHVYDLTPVTYYHFMFDSHQIVRADGIWAESLRPGPAVLSTLGRAAQEELFEIFPELREAEEAPFPAARPLLRDWETAVLLQS